MMLCVLFLARMYHADIYQHRPRASRPRQRDAKEGVSADSWYGRAQLNPHTNGVLHGTIIRMAFVGSDMQ